MSTERPLIGCDWHDGADIDACGCPALDSPGAIAYRGLLVKARAEITRLTAERDQAVAHRAATNAEIKRLHAVIKDKGFSVEDSVALHETRSEVYALRAEVQKLNDRETGWRDFVDDERRKRIIAEQALTIAEQSLTEVRQLVADMREWLPPEGTIECGDEIDDLNTIRSRITALGILSNINDVLNRHGIKRCGDSSCIFGPCGGMMTNGGCRCGQDDPGAPSRPTRLSRQLARAVTEQGAEIARLTDALCAEQDKRSDAIRERNEAIEEARNATAVNVILKAEVPRLEAEVARLTAALTTARAVPTDVEALVKETVDGALEAGRCSALGHAYLLTKDPAYTVPRLKAAIARAISDATAMPLGGEWALVAAMRDATAQLAVNNDPSSINKGRCDEWANRVAAAVPGATAVWLDSIIDADDFPIDAQPRVGHCVVEYSGRWYDSEHALGVDDVGLLAGLDRGALATAARGTVGGLLATAREGEIVEWRDELTWRQVRGGEIRIRDIDGGTWGSWWPTTGYLIDDWRRPARRVPVAEADADPNQRGPLPKGG